MTPDRPGRLTRPTAFHARIAALTRNFIDYRGFWLPAAFPAYGAAAEYLACREGAAVMDLSPLRKLEVTGPDAERLLDATLTRDIRKLAVGQVVYTAMCNQQGGVLDDGTVFRLCQNNFRFICGADHTGAALRDYARAHNLRAFVRDSTDQLHNLAVQGPRSREVLRPILWTPPGRATLDELQWFRFTIGRLGGPNGAPVLVSRTGYSGELGFEVFCHPKDGDAVWDAVWDAGKAEGLTPLGMDALDMLRIEAGLVFAGYEFNEQIDPFEAGIGFTVALSKDTDFVGKAALVERKAHPQRVLVGLELEGDEPAAHGDCVHDGFSQIGVVTSAMRSPVLRKNIALCRIAVQHAAVGTTVEVGKLDGHQKRLVAKVAPFPFYDPKKERPRRG